MLQGNHYNLLKDKIGSNISHAKRDIFRSIRDDIYHLYFFEDCLCKVRCYMLNNDPKCFSIRTPCMGICNPKNYILRVLRKYKYKHGIQEKSDTSGHLRVNEVPNIHILKDLRACGIKHKSTRTCLQSATSPRL